MEGTADTVREDMADTIKEVNRVFRNRNIQISIV